MSGETCVATLLYGQLKSQPKTASPWCTGMGARVQACECMEVVLTADEFDICTAATKGHTAVSAIPLQIDSMTREVEGEACRAARAGRAPL